MQKTIKKMRRKLNEIALVILGDPTDQTNPGVMIRLDRLERSNQIKTKLIWVLISAVTIGLFSLL